MIFFAIVIGISQGIQPIISYNYGAGKYERVKSTYKKAVTAAIGISIVAFLLFQLMPRQIIFLLPLLIILPFFIGIEGVMFSAPIADGVAAVLCIFFIVQEFKQMGEKKVEIK